MKENNNFIDLFSQITNSHASKDEGFEPIYVIYARKSTDDKDRQVRSLADQISECRDFGKRMGLKIASKVLKESQSAKQSDIRPIFREMIEDIKRGKYHAILAWHPDRLARNMKEAGEIIDLLDKEVITDLKFVSQSFENTSAGKVQLGITFVLAKEYSDRLSENVRRGIRRSLFEGKYVSMGKHGYYKDSQQFLRPDGENFIFLKNAFKMRLEGKRLEDMAKYLNECGYKTWTKKRGSFLYKMDVKKLSRIIRDPIYAGVLVHGDNRISLKTTYDFVPMITELEFKIINKDNLDLRFSLKNRNKDENNVKADFLRGMVICGYCNHNLVSSITHKHNKKDHSKVTNYYYYRCDTLGCKRKGKSIRPKIIVAFVSNILENTDFTDKRLYDHYLKEMEVVIKDKNKLLKIEINSIELNIQRLEKAVKETMKYLVEENDREIKEDFKADLKVKKQELLMQRELLNKKKAELNIQKEAFLTYSQFLELFQKLALEISKGTSLEKKNYLIKKIFSNLTLKGDKVVSYKLNSPFKEFNEQGFFSNGRGAGT